MRTASLKRRGSVEKGEPMPYFVIVRKRSTGWDWSKPMRRQAAWDDHAAFMDRMAAGGFIVAAGPLGDEDDAPEVMHVASAADRNVVERCMAEDPWTPMHLLETVSVTAWTVLLGGFRHDASE